MLITEILEIGEDFRREFQTRTCMEAAKVKTSGPAGLSTFAVLVRRTGRPALRGVLERMDALGVSGHTSAAGEFDDGAFVFFLVGVGRCDSGGEEGGRGFG